MAEDDNDARLSFKEATNWVRDQGRAAFCAIPVFGDEATEDAQAEGARLFLLLPDAEDGWHLRFIAGPFFSAAYAVNDVIDADQVPDSVRQLRFMPTRCEEAWLEEQIQVLLGRLCQAAGVGGDLPDYADQAIKGAAPQVVFPVHFLGRGKTP